MKCRGGCLLASNPPRPPEAVVLLVAAGRLLCGPCACFGEEAVLGTAWGSQQQTVLAGSLHSVPVKLDW